MRIIAIEYATLSALATTLMSGSSTGGVVLVQDVAAGGTNAAPRVVKAPPPPLPPWLGFTDSTLPSKTEKHYQRSNNQPFYAGVPKRARNKRRK